MTAPTTPSRDRTRAQIIEVAARLLESSGPAAVTTRAVADAAGVQAPTLYRLFGDKVGLLDAVVEQGFGAYVASSGTAGDGGDPVTDLERAWRVHVGFGLEHPALYRVMLAMDRGPVRSEAVEAGIALLRERVGRVAAAGRLAVPVERAVGLIHATGTGVVLALIGQDEPGRDAGLERAAWRSVAAAILVGADAVVADASAAAVTLRAALPGLAGFSGAERALLSEWLDRIPSSAT